MWQVEPGIGNAMILRRPERLQDPGDGPNEESRDMAGVLA